MHTITHCAANRRRPNRTRCKRELSTCDRCADPQWAYSPCLRGGHARNIKAKAHSNSVKCMLSLCGERDGRACNRDDRSDRACDRVLADARAPEPRRSERPETEMVRTPVCLCLYSITIAAHATKLTTMRRPTGERDHSPHSSDARFTQRYKFRSEPHREIIDPSIIPSAHIADTGTLWHATPQAHMPSRTHSKTYNNK